VEGASMMLESTDAANELPENWCTASKPWAGGDKGSPGLANDCP
jgi:hypothetical protein